MAARAVNLTRSRLSISVENGTRVTKDYPWMIYGATGISGGLIARKAVARGLRPILAGRDPRALQRIAAELGLSWRVFEMTDWGRFRREISRVNLLVNAAGPLMQASVLVAESCLAVDTHYFDLSNQVPSLVAIYMLDAEAKDKNLTLLPGMALSPAASNCLVEHLHTLLPAADSLDIALEPFLETHVPGANLTIAENIVQSGFRRRDGALERYGFGNGMIEVVLPTGVRRMLPSALGDVEAAYYSTKLPNIATYLIVDIPAFSDSFKQTVGASSIRVSPAELKTENGDSPTGNDGKHLVGSSNLEDDNHLDKKQSLVWARMSKTGHASLEGWLQLGEGHDFTASLVIAGVSRLADKKQLSVGTHTAATALGADFILELPNVTRTVQYLTE